jgi:serine/threonine-protein kinase
MNSRVTSFKMRELFPLGEGGMGITYLGCAKGVGGFERLIAIKRLHDHLQSDEDARTRLLFEAELAGCVQHANVVGVQHVDQDERGAFLVLDYVDGGSLSQLLHTCRPRRLPQPLVLRVILDCLAGLEAIHTATNHRGESLQILHRDISPDNVLIGLDGTARLTDFGIARANHHPALTGPTQLVGKLTFMAPEYIDKRDLGPTLDVYSLGVMMWILLAGQSPWKGLEDAQLLARLLTDGVPPLPSDFDQEIRAIVARACAKDPAKRYASARLMAGALENLAMPIP